MGGIFLAAIPLLSSHLIFTSYLQPNRQAGISTLKGEHQILHFGQTAVFKCPIFRLYFRYSFEMYASTRLSHEIGKKTSAPGCLPKEMGPFFSLSKNKTSLYFFLLIQSRSPSSVNRLPTSVNKLH